MADKRGAGVLAGATGAQATGLLSRSADLPALWPSLRAALRREMAYGLLPVLLSCAFLSGILAYFIVPDEPVALVPLALSALAGGLGLRLRHRHFASFVTLASLACLLFGFGWPGLKGQWIGIEPLTAPTNVLVRGFVEAVEPRKDSFRVTLRLINAEPALKEPLQKVRFALRGAEKLAVGQPLSVRVRLMPLPGSSHPGGYDFGREIAFAGIGATGFAISRPQDWREPPVTPLDLRFSALIDSARRAVSDRIRLHIPGETGALADALVTGRRNGISETTDDTLRRAGVYHILSISGFHMTLVAAFVFAMLRGLLALIPGIALHYPVKPWAAAAALVISTAYLMLSGAEVATQRSYVMIAIVLIGIMAGREAVTLRNLALSVFAVLLLAPEAALGPSFQMSFAATLVLVAGIAQIRPRLEALVSGEHVLGRMALAFSHSLFALMLTSLVATLATMPFAAYHFHTLHFYGVLGNVIAAPVIEFVTMPLEMLALLLWPFGLDGPVLALAGHSITVFMRLSEAVGALAGGAVRVKAFTGLSLALMALGLVMIGALRTRLRLAGLAPATLGLVLAIHAERPDFYADAEAKTFALRSSDGRLTLASDKGNVFALGQWLAADGDPRKGNDPSLATLRRCDSSGCATPLPSGGVLVVNTRSEALAEDCRMAKIVIADRLPAFNCTAQVITRDMLRRHGASSLAFDAEGRLQMPSETRRASPRLWQAHPRQTTQIKPEEPETPSGPLPEQDQ